MPRKAILGDERLRPGAWRLCGFCRTACEIVFSCEKSACGEGFLKAFYGLAPFANDPGWDNSAPITNGNPDFSYVLVARSAGGEGMI